MTNRSDRSSRRRHRVSVYLSDDELALIDMAAARVRRERPDWMRLALLDSANAVVSRAPAAASSPSAPRVVPAAEVQR